jgi:6-phosphogluconolactonase (cycloisomerase 2 family)
MRFPLSLLTLLCSLLFCLFQAGCNTRSGSTSGGETPGDLDYGTGFLQVTDCVAFGPLVPTVVGDALVFSVDPPLPAGLSLNPNTGAISGQPEAPQGNSFHVVTASNNLGSTTAGLTIQVLWPAAPEGLGYATPLASYDLGVAITPNAPSLAVAPAGNYVYTVEPALPTGLALSSSTGVISGVPQAVVGGAAFTLRAQDCVGQSTSAVVWIEVLPAPGSADEPAGYATANADGTLSLFEVDPSSGVVAPAGYLPIGAAPTDLASSADGTKLFALQSGGSVAAFALDGQGGVLALPGSPTFLPGFSGNGGLAVDPLGRTIYVSDGPSDRVQALAIGALGGLSALGSALTVSGDFSGAQSPGPMAVTPDGSGLLVLNLASETLSLIGLNGDGSLAGQVAEPTGSGPRDVVVGRLANGQQYAYVVNSTVASVSVYRLAPGQLIPVQTHALPAGSVPTKLAFVERNGQRFVYVAKTATQLVVPLPVQGQNGTLSGPFVAFSATGVSDLGFAPNGEFGFVLSGSQQRLTGVTAAANTGALSSTLDAPLDCLRLRATPVSSVPLVATAAKLRRSRQVYAASPTAGVLSQFAFAPQSASLAPLNPASQVAGNAPTAAAVSRNGAFLVSSDAQGFAGPDVFLFGTNAGSLAGQSAIDLGAVFGGSISGAGAVGIEPSDRFAYVLRAGQPGALHGYRVEGAGFVSPVVATVGNDPSGLLCDPSGRFAFVANRTDGLVSVYALDAWSGQPSLVTSQGVAAEPVALATDLGGCFLFVLHAGDGRVQTYQVNPQSGVLAFVGQGFGASAGARALAVDPLGRFLVVADSEQGQLRRFRLSDGSDGNLPGTPVLIGSTPAGGNPGALAFDRQGLSLVVALPDQGLVRTFRVDGQSLSAADSDFANPEVGGLAVRSVLE